MEVIIYSPKTVNGINELQKRVSTIHAKAVVEHLNREACPLAQKLNLCDAVKTVSKKIIN